MHVGKKRRGVQPFLQGDFHLPKVEEKVLTFWRTNQIFEKSLALRQAQGKKHFVFFEGPPTANGRPGLHHVLARAFKDIILRYRTMRGYAVLRKGGWDTHGLPVEIEVEKELGLKSKRDIEKFGIAEFNRKCRESVWKYKDEWEKLTERMGFWLDLEHPYITYEKNYIETLWWIVKHIWKKGLLYKGHKVVPWCTRCGTALSSHEMALGYKEVTDNSVYVKFKLKKGQKIGNFKTNDKTYILSWTTTPWTLPGNVALAVGKDINYMRVTVTEVSSHSINLKKGETYIFAATEDADRRILGVSTEHPPGDLSRADFRGDGGGGKFTDIADFKGKSLVGLAYEPLFKVVALKNKNSHKIYAADFVTTDEGTGVVHTAVMYGEDDYQLGKKTGLPQHHTVDERGKFTKDVSGLAGRYVKAEKTENVIFAHLKKKNLLFATQAYTHDYPFCWRCETPLLYYARTSWFVAMAKLRSKLLKNNNAINWIPKHLKEGRFGEWLKEVKDWNFSRERYWGTPIPLWECTKCGKTEVMGGVEELHRRSVKQNNTYWIMRHGYTEALIVDVIDSGQGAYHLTPTGKQEVQKVGKRLRKEKIDIVVASPVLRTKETARIIAAALGIKKVHFDPRIREINLGKLTGKPSRTYWKEFPTYESRFETRPEKGESLRDVRMRTWKFLQDIEKKYHGKRILFVSHEYPIWILSHLAEGSTEKETIIDKKKRGKNFIDPAELRELIIKNIPRDETGLVDLHRPYVDEIVFACTKCRGEMRRIKELADVWFDSGAMPFAQVHWPFAQNQKLKVKNQNNKLQYPADYIAEAMDQTRGWFYTLLAVSTLLGRGTSYKNVISLGLIHDKYGQKMSKSKGNVVDPWRMIEKYGIDAVRWYMYTATPPGEPKNFNEEDIAKALRRFHLILYNSFVFYTTYAHPISHFSSLVSSRHVLDKWIVARLHETIEKATRHLDRYEIREAGLLIEKLVDDLSRWYIRRSRRRLQRPANRKDYLSASQTLGYILHEICRLLAPFTPFFAEALYRNVSDRESVHLTDWPKAQKKAVDQKLIDAMDEVRRLASLALARRAELGIKVRQPLAALKIKDQKSRIKKDKKVLALLADEVNVKKVVFDSTLKGEVEFDSRITAALRDEGLLRELIRTVQDLRQRAGLRPQDTIALMLDLPENLKSVASGHGKFLKQEVGAKSVEYRKSLKFSAEINTKVDGSKVWLGVRKVR